MELLTEGETCLAFNPGDPQDLAEKLKWAKAHPQELARVGEGGYNLYRSRLTASHLAERLLERINSDALTYSI